jgi:hypothetical protein
MYIQVHTGEGNQYSQDHGGDAHGGAVQKQYCSGFKRSNGVTGGEGEVVGQLYQQFTAGKKIVPCSS